MVNIRDLLIQWNKQHGERTKLQHAYAVLAVAALLVAGLISLVNYSLGQSLLFIAIVLGLVFVANSVVWALLDTFVIRRVPKTSHVVKKRQ